MCCGKETYEKVKEGQVGLTRRKVLKAMGVGTGLLTLGGLTGCTSWIRLSDLTSQEAVVSALGTRQGQDAFARLNKKLLNELKQQVKGAIQALRKGDNVSAISSARQALERLFQHYHEIELTKTLEQGAYEGLKAFKGLEQEVIAELRRMEIDEQDMEMVEEAALKARDKLLGEPQIHVDTLMNDALAALRELESKIRSQALAQTTLSAQGFWGCFFTVVGTIGAGIATAAACAACAAEPTRITCAGCVGAGLVTIGGIGYIFTEDSPC